MNDRLYETLMKLPRHNLICLMEEALDIMQGYNGQTRMECIIAAIGGRTEENPENGHMRHYIPSLKTIKQNTQTIIQY